MATWRQLQNLKKCVNQFRHRWIDRGREAGRGDTYDYYCKYCRAERIKVTAYSSVYRRAGAIDEWQERAPECVERVGAHKK